MNSKQNIVEMPMHGKVSDAFTISAMLTTAEKHFIHAAHVIEQMQADVIAGNIDLYWAAHEQLSEHLTVGGHALTEANRLQLATNILPNTGGAA